MLKQRVITALIAAPTVIAAIFFLPITAFAAVFLVLAGLGVFEWANLAGLRSNSAKVAYVAVYALIGYALLNAPTLWPTVLQYVVAFWVLAAVVVLTFPASGQALIRPVLVPAGYVAFVGAWLSLVVLLGAGGPWLILWVLVVVWSADIGAYFAGRQFGRRKLALLVSPGKTWEGAIGGTLLSVLLGSSMGATVPALYTVAPELWQWIVGSLIIAIVSIFGDLFESALKRARGVKDSGGLFPGHGGMLDRVDSLIAALPCVALAVAGPH
jgi:phosphatidate cytidylyltransferase